MEKEPSKNVLGGDLIPCSMDPVTGSFAMGPATHVQKIGVATRSAPLWIKNF